MNVRKESLGEWLLDVRRQLKRGDPIDLKQAPPSVQWIRLSKENANELRLQAAKTVPPSGIGSVMVLAESRPAKMHQCIARETAGAVTVEAVSLYDLMNFAEKFRDPSSSNAPRELLAFAQKVIRNVDSASIMRRIDSLRNGTAENAASKVESAMRSFIETPSFGLAATVLGEIEKFEMDGVYRPLILQSCLHALQISQNSGTGFYDAVIRVREENSIAGRRTPQRAVGSTLLLKGLEADVAVVLNASDLNARNLYVAMTRCTRKLVVCAKSNILNPPD